MLLRDNEYQNKMEQRSVLTDSIAQTLEENGKEATRAAELKKKLKSLQQEVDTTTQDIHKLDFAIQQTNQEIQRQRAELHQVEESISKHELEKSIRDLIAEYDDFYIMFEREVKKAQDNLTQNTPYSLDLIDPATASKTLRNQVEGGGISQGLVEIRSFIHHYDQAIRSICEVRAAGRKPSLEQLQQPHLVVVRAMENKHYQRLWYPV